MTIAPEGRKLLRLEVRNAETPIEKKPPWIKTRATMGPEYTELKSLVKREGLHTVCEAAGCPNIFECWEDREATFLIGGDQCTRRCDFCQIDTGKPEPLDRDEPRRVAESVQAMGLRYATITGVARDDLPDGGAWLYAETVKQIHALNPGTGVENLIPDFNGKPDLLAEVFESRPEVLAHNVETVPRIFRRIRPAFTYERSLDVITQARDFGLVTKSNLILGMGEERAEVSQALRDLHAAGCELITITQYLRPSKRHHPVERWVQPEEFVELQAEAEQIGFAGVMSGPLVRSSYRAGRLYRQAVAGPREHGRRRPGLRSFRRTFHPRHTLVTVLGSSGGMTRALPPMASFSQLVSTAVRAATAHLAEGSRRNAREALEVRYDLTRQGFEVVAALQPRPARSRRCRPSSAPRPEPGGHRACVAPPSGGPRILPAMARKDTPAETPKKQGRAGQIRAAYSMTRKVDPMVGWVTAAAGFLTWAVAVAIGFLIGHPIYLGIIGLMLAVLAATIVFGKRAEKAAFSSVEGQPGAAAAALNMLRRGWTVTPAVAVTRNQDIVHRAVGRAGVVLVGEGLPDPGHGAARDREEEGRPVRAGRPDLRRPGGQRGRPGAAAQAQQPPDEAAAQPQDARR